MKKLIKKIFEYFGLEINKINKHDSYSSDFETEFIKIFLKSKDYTMTSCERMYSLYKSIEYISKNDIEGDIVECGVWKGGSSMLAAQTLMKFNNIKDIYLYDTFDGMSEPTDKDIDINGNKADKLLEKHQKIDSDVIWCYSDLESVRKNMSLTNYDLKKVHFIKGKVEDTIPKNVPSKISLLRLDTDWFESTYHELKYLFPLLSKNGVLIIDDYGHWKGAKEAVDKYIKEENITILLNRIDYTGRIGIKI